MKLCRFELLAEPNKARTGFVAQGKVYETDGQQPIGIHLPSDVRLLSPALPPSIRLFTGEGDDLGFVYLNPATVRGSGEPIPLPPFATPAGYMPCVAAVIAVAGKGLEPSEADGLVLGLSLGLVIYGGAGDSARSRDVGFVLGPAITTPDDLEDRATEDARGRRYHLEIGARRGEDMPLKTSLADIEPTLAELIAYASESAVLRPGDVIAYALPQIVEGTLEPGHDVAVLSDALGTLAARAI